MIILACESGFLLEENGASQNAMNLKSCTGIGRITMATSWYLFPESACKGFFVKKQPLYYIFTPSHLLIYIFTPSHLLI